MYVEFFAYNDITTVIHELKFVKIICMKIIYLY